MTVRDQESLTTGLQWTCTNTSNTINTEARDNYNILENGAFILLHDGIIVRGNTRVKNVQTSTDNPLIAVTNRTKKSKNI